MAGIPASLRARGRAWCRFEASNGRTHLADLAEGGGYRVKFPAGPAMEAVLINTGGGMAGGDSLDLRLGLGEASDAVVTTQSAEKVYRADGMVSRVAVEVSCAPGARLAWLPQETILFCGARLTRRLSVDMAADATVTLAESVVFGRLAMGETVASGLFQDCWRIRRAGRLVLAEAVSLDGPIAALLDRPALGAGARAVATLVHVAPDAAQRLDPVRAVLAGGASDAGASAWNGALVVRLAAADPARLRVEVAAVLACLSARALPRVWQT